VDLLRCSVLVDKPSSMDSDIVIGMMTSGNDNNEKTCSILILVSAPKPSLYLSTSKDCQNCNDSSCSSPLRDQYTLEWGVAKFSICEGKEQQGFLMQRLSDAQNQIGRVVIHLDDNG
jgi:hypothetical protein